MGAAVVVLAGLILASFIGSLSYRLPRHISMVSPPSFCASCGTRIKPYDLIPVLSYLILRGRCRECGAVIPLRHFLIELAAPLVYLALYLTLGIGIAFFIYSYLVSLLFYLSLVDIETGSVGVLDCLLVYMGGAFLIYFAFTGKFAYGFTHYLYGAVVSLALVSASFFFTYIIKRKVPMGAGDLLLIPGVSLYFGVNQVMRILIFASLIGILLGAVLIVSGRVKQDHKFPMIPFLLSGVITEIFFFQ